MQKVAKQLFIRQTTYMYVFIHVTGIHAHVKAVISNGMKNSLFGRHFEQQCILHRLIKHV